MCAMYVQLQYLEPHQYNPLSYSNTYYTLTIVIIEYDNTELALG